jgi:hypothetical protein
MKCTDSLPRGLGRGTTIVVDERANKHELNFCNPIKRKIPYKSF